jgi:RuvB-like protein 1 (pontin 52)
VQTEGLQITEPALEKVADAGVRVSLRYALQLLAPSSIVARASGRNEIDVLHVAECEDLFIDARRSALSLTSEGNGYIA